MRSMSMAPRADAKLGFDDYLDPAKDCGGVDSTCIAAPSRSSPTSLPGPRARDSSPRSMPSRQGARNRRPIIHVRIGAAPRRGDDINGIHGGLAGALPRFLSAQYPTATPAIEGSRWTEFGPALRRED